MLRTQNLGSAHLWTYSPRALLGSAESASASPRCVVSRMRMSVFAGDFGSVVAVVTIADAVAADVAVGMADFAGDG